MTKVAIVEDSRSTRESLEAVINLSSDCRCVCTCESAEEALRELPRHEPEIVLMDINMPGMSGVKCVSLLKKLLPQARVVMITVYRNPDQIFGALRAGACGYLLKRSSPEQILQGIYNPNGSLLLGSSGTVYLHQNDTFKSVLVNGSSLATGTYSFTTLNSLYPASFPSSWTRQNGSAVNTASGSITVLANSAPIILTPPQPASLSQGQAAATFNVVAAGAAPLNYRWFTNGTVALSNNANRMGSTSNVLTIPNPTVGDSGIYSVVVTNNYGSVTSAPVTLTVSLPGPTTIALHDAPLGVTNTLASTSIDLPFTVTPGANVLVVVLLDKSSSSAGVTPSTLIWNGLTLTRAITTVDSGSIYRDTAIYYVYNPTAGTANITGTLTATPVCSYLEAYSLSGVDTASLPRTGDANSVSGTNLSFNVANVAANSWAAVGGVLGAYGVAGVSVTGTGGNNSGIFYGNDTSADNCAFAFGYLSGLSAGLDTIQYSWNLTGRTPTANTFAAAVFAPRPSPPRITSINFNNTTLSISATNGTAGAVWTLLQSTSLAVPLSQWQTNSAGVFDNNGNLSASFANTATNHQEFYILKVQ